MERPLIRLGAMLSRLLLAAVVATGASAFAQSGDFSAPPLIPADGEVAEPLPQPWPGQPQGQQPQYQQPSGQQPQYQQPQYQQPQYQQPQYQQPQYQQPQYQPPQYQPPQYQQPTDQQYQQYPQQPQYPQQQPQYPQQQPAPQQPPTATQPAAAKPVHFVGLLSGSVGIAPDVSGFIGGVRAELDINRVGLLLQYNNFLTTAFTLSQVHQFSAMGGYSLVSEDIFRLRALGGLDVMANDGVVGLGPIVGANMRLTFGALGIDAAAFLTPLPFRQLDLRAALVLAWSIFEFHLGWRMQVIDATADGSFARLFSLSPAINGPSAGIGLAL